MTLFDQFGDTEEEESPITTDPTIELEEQLTPTKEDSYYSVCTTCKPMGPPVNRSEHFVTDETTRTCWACYVPVRLKGEKWYIDEDRQVCLCEEHKDYEGRHGGAADPKFSPKGNPLDVARLLRTGTPAGYKGKGKSRRSAPTPPPLVVKSVDDEIEPGEVVDEVAEFLKSMGRL